MKTRISILLGAALSLLMTLTPAQAGRGKGGGGNGGGGSGGEATPEGTIYYYGNFPGWSGTPSISMNADGSNKTVIGSDGWSTIFGNPSLNPHANHRWFLKLVPFAGEYAPDGAGRVELHALRDDFNPDSNNTPQTMAQLTDDPTLQPLGGMHWMPGDTYVSFVARRWSSADPGATVVEGGIYVVPLVYDADGSIIGLGEGPGTPAIPLPLVPDPYPQPGVDAHLRPDVIHYSWDPSASRFVYTKLSDPYGVWVADVVGTETKISSDPGHKPEWSPDGSTIVYGAGGGFITIKPNGKRRTWILQSTSTTSYYYAYWSPDSRNLVFTGQANESGGLNHDVYRANANGGELVNLTDTPAPDREMTFGDNAGWR